MSASSSDASSSEGGASSSESEAPASGDEASTESGASSDGDTSSAGDDTSSPAQVRVVQCNPYYSGRLDAYDLGASCDASSECADTCSDAADVDCGECIDHRCHVRSWATAKDLAARIRDIEAEVIGIEEMPPPYAEVVAGILAETTGVAWEHRVVDQGVGGVGSGVGVMWRSDRVALVHDFGYVDADVLDSGYIIRVAGVLLQPVDSDRTFGMFAGKLDWHSENVEGRRVQAQRVRDWIDARMAAFPEAHARMFAVDLNDTPGSPAHEVFASEYDDGGAVKHTIPASAPEGEHGRRIDFLWWSAGVPGPEHDGFVGAQSDGRLGRSGFFGSDHRFVYGDALVP